MTSGDAVAADTAARFRALAEDTIEDLLRLGPERATDLGDHRFDAEVESNQEVIRIAVDARATELLQQLDALPRLRAALRDVAERDDQIRLTGLQIGERSAEGDRVAVHVRDECDSHSEQLMGTP